MSKKMQTVTCGQYQRIIIYSGGSSNQRTALQRRRDRQRVSSEKKRLSNFKTAQNRFRALVYGNVKPSWTVVTLTFDDEHVPRSKRAAISYWNRFAADVRKWVKSTALKEWRYFRIIEDKHGAGRPHIHLLTNVPLALREEFLTIWEFGSFDCQDMKQVEMDTAGNVDAAGLCRYLSKERRGVDERLYTTSKNLIRIDRGAVEAVADDMEIGAVPLPNGHVILDRQEWRTLYGYIGYIDFLTYQRE